MPKWNLVRWHWNDKKKFCILKMVCFFLKASNLFFPPLFQSAWRFFRWAQWNEFQQSRSFLTSYSISKGYYSNESSTGFYLSSGLFWPSSACFSRHACFCDGSLIPFTRCVNCASPIRYRLLSVRIQFVLKAINLQTVRHRELPDCYDFKVMVCDLWIAVELVLKQVVVF